MEARALNHWTIREILGERKRERTEGRKEEKKKEILRLLNL